MKDRTGQVAAFALALALVSLAINAVLVIRLREAQATLEPLLPAVEGLIDSTGVVRTSVRIPAGTPINLDVPVDERVSVRVDTVLPLNTTIQVPLRSPLGNYRIPVPIRANVPIRATIPIRLRHTFQLRTRTPENLDVPIEVGTQ